MLTDRLAFTSSIRPVIGDVLHFEDEDNGRLVVTIRLKGTMAARFRQANPVLVQLAFGTPNDKLNCE